MDLPDNFDMTWVLIEGPKLDKQVLAYMEYNTDEYPDFPEWLKPLWEGVISSKNWDTNLQMLRTLLVFGYKAKYEPSKDQIKASVDAYIEADAGVGTFASVFKGEDGSNWPVFRTARRLIGRVVSRLDLSEVIPSYGPGAVFPSRKPSEKGNFIVCDEINRYYPYDAFFNTLPETGAVDRHRLSYWYYRKIAAKMVAVPKDSRGPRLISVHPSESIWIQQGQRRKLEKAIEQHPLTKGRVNFKDQKINGALALSSSQDRKYTTIDLKEASDRVSKVLVEYLFGYLSKLLGCTRATHVYTLDNRLVELNAWAPMGNCLTFPVESLVFWALVRAGISCRHGVSCDDVYVFGDDIIVPTQYYEGAIYGLVVAGLIPNANKTFRKGFFRESCGVDAYLGKDVTPFRCKVQGIVSYADAESACDLAKRLRRAGFSDTSAYLYRLVAKRFGRLSLTNNPDCQGLVEYVDVDVFKLIAMEPRVFWHKFSHTLRVPYRRRVRTVESLHKHAWWHVQDSLLRLELLAHGESLIPEEEIPLESGYSERGLAYPSPRGERLERSSVEILSPSSVSWVVGAHYELRTTD
jgi:hypothetical protein